MQLLFHSNVLTYIFHLRPATYAKATMIFRWLNARQPLNTERLQESDNFSEGKFQNKQQHLRKGKWAALAYLKRLLFTASAERIPAAPIPMEFINSDSLMGLDHSNIHIFRLGHSTMLLKLGADFWLIDPVFSQRASPFKFIGPKRFHPSPISIADLPPIKGVIISHNHYDHLDRLSIRALKSKTEHFYVPLGVDGDLIAWGVAASQVSTFDWWQSLKIDAVSLHFTPAHHYSGRGLDDNCATLWGSWVIQFNQQSVFFSGDSGYFAGFKEIGNKYGPFNICMIETGGYDAQWPVVHMQPEQGLQAFIDLKGKALLPIHNTTFNLAFHPWNHPLISISKLAAVANVELLIPKFGQVVTVGKPLRLTQWWL